MINIHTLLIVDDNPSVLKDLSNLLKDHYRVLTAADGFEALRQLEQQVVHIVLSDDGIPLMTGTELLGEIRVLYPSVVRLLMGSGKDPSRLIEAAREGLCHRFFAKPLALDELMSTLRQAAEQHEQTGRT